MYDIKSSIKLQTFCLRKSCDQSIFKNIFFKVFTMLFVYVPILLYIKKNLNLGYLCNVFPNLIIMIYFQIVKFIRDHARRQRSRLSNRHLKKIPIRKFKKGSYTSFLSITALSLLRNIKTLNREDQVTSLQLF